MAENFIYMHAEEAEHNSVLWASHGDAQLRALEGRIAVSLPHSQHLLSIRWMVPAPPHEDFSSLSVNHEK